MYKHINNVHVLQTITNVNEREQMYNALNPDRRMYLFI